MTQLHICLFYERRPFITVHSAYLAFHYFDLACCILHRLVMAKASIGSLTALPSFKKGVN